MFGPIAPQPTLLKAAELAHKLNTWRLGRITSSGAEAGSLLSGDAVEFGSDLEFRVPAIAAGQLELDSEDYYDGEVLNTRDAKKLKEAPAEQHSSHDRPLEEIYSVPEEVHNIQDEGGGGGTDLRWYKRMCDKAAESGAGAQFSGDELAVAVAHVLESERSGDEVGHFLQFGLSKGRKEEFF